MTGQQPGILKSASPLWFAEVAVVSAGVLVVVASARLLGPADYGTVALALAAPQLIAALLEPRSGQVGVRFVSRFRVDGRPDRARAVALLSVIVDGSFALAATIISCALSPWLTRSLLSGDGSPWLIVGFALSLLLRSPTVAALDLTGALGSFAQVGWIRTLGATCRLAITVPLLFLWRSPSAVMVGFAAGAAAEFVLAMFVLHRRSVSELGGSIFSSDLATLAGERSELFRHVAHADATGFLRVIGTQSDVLVLGFVASSSEVGAYRLARQLIAPAISLLVPLQTALLPRLSHLAASGQLAEARAAALSAGKRVGLPVSLAFALGALLSPVLIAVAGGVEYGAAVGPARWLMTLGALWALTAWAHPLLIALGKMSTLTVTMAIGTGITLTGFWILGTAFGATGVAASRTVGMGLCTGGLWAWFALRATYPETTRTPCEP